jgi:hypothetical protein
VDYITVTQRRDFQYPHEAVYTARLHGASGIIIAIFDSHNPATAVKFVQTINRRRGLPVRYWNMKTRTAPPGSADWLLGNPRIKAGGPTVATAEWWTTFYNRREEAPEK